MSSNVDPHHNEYLDTNDMLHRGFEENMRRMGVDLTQIPDDIKQRRGIGSQEQKDDRAAPFGETFFMTARPDHKGERRKITTEAGEELEVVHSDESAHVSGEFLQKSGELAVNAKERAIAAFRLAASDSEVAGELKGVIRALERLEEYYGIESAPFDPLRHISGLRPKGEILANANEVVETTMRSYELYPVTEIKAGLNENRPVIALTIVGEEQDAGFVVRATVTAQRDFAGNEAIDYVHSKKRGLVTVKAFERGRWVDVSDDFVIHMKVKSYKLEEGELPHSVFVGEKIIREGKEIIPKKLNLNKDDIKFGEHQVFVKDAETASAIRKLISSN